MKPLLQYFDNGSCCITNYLGVQLSKTWLKNHFLGDERIYASLIGDFVVEDKYIFEVGGKNKSFKQIKDIENSFVVADDLEVGFRAKIPLYLFGFLY